MTLARLPGRALPGHHSGAPEAVRNAVVVGALMCALSGCTSIQLALGMKMRLDEVPVTALSAALIPGPGLAPGGAARLVIVATSDDGKRYVTEGAGQGKVLFDSFTITPNLVEVDAEGKVSLAADPRASQGQLPHVHIVANGHPQVAADLDVPVRYDADFSALFSGAAGRPGMDGRSGLDGMSGMPGSNDPNYPSPGGNGGNGEDGGNGDDGGPGAPGPAVDAEITLLPGPPALLQVLVAGGGREQRYLVDPAGGRLLIEASGGVGGRGGTGGRGGRGGAGGSGTPNGSAGSDGHNGLDGSNGRGGAPGTITLTIDPRALPYYDRLLLVNQSGSGAPGPTPTVRVVPVPPLW